MKKFLSLVVAALLLVSAVATTATAGKFTDVDASNEALNNAVDLLVALKVTKGTTDTTFGADEDVTRQQMAAFMYRMMKGGKAEPANSVNYSKFTDLVDPYYNYVITWASTEGIIKGRDAANTIFDPNGGIILQDAYTMMVRALGYDDGSYNYPIDYIEKAEELGLDASIPSNVDYTAALKRGDVAILLHNMFYAETADVEISYDTSDNKLTPIETRYTLGQVAFGVEKASYIVTLTANYALDGNKERGQTTKVTLEDDPTDDVVAPEMAPVEFAELGLTGSSDSYFLSTVSLFVKDGKILGAAANGTKKTVDFSKVAVSVNDTKKLTGVKIDGVDVNFEKATFITLGENADWAKDAKTNNYFNFATIDNTSDLANGTSAIGDTIPGLKVAAAGGFGEVDVYDVDTDGAYDYIFFKPYSVVKVDTDTKDTNPSTPDASAGAGLKAFETQRARVEGEAKNNDIVLAYVNADARYIKVAKVLTESVNATIKTKDSTSLTLSNDAKIVIDDLTDLYANYAAILPAASSDVVVVDGSNKLVDYDFYFVDGKLVYYAEPSGEVNSATATDPKANWVIVVDGVKDSKTVLVQVDGGFETKTTYYTTVYMDGKLQEVKVDENYDFTGKVRVLSTAKVNKDGEYEFTAYAVSTYFEDGAALNNTKAFEVLTGVTGSTTVVEKADAGYYTIEGCEYDTDKLRKLNAVDGIQFIIHSKVEKLDEEGNVVTWDHDEDDSTDEVAVLEDTITVYDALPELPENFEFTEVQYIVSNDVNSKIYENLVVFYGYYADVIGEDGPSATETKVVVKGHVIDYVAGENDTVTPLVKYTVIGMDGKEFTAVSGTDATEAKRVLGDVCVLNSDGTLADGARDGNIFVTEAGEGYIARETVEAYDANAKRVEIDGDEYYLTDATVITKVYIKGDTKTVSAGATTDIKADAKVIKAFETKNTVNYLTSVIVVVVEA